MSAEPAPEPSTSASPVPPAPVEDVAMTDAPQEAEPEEFEVVYIHNLNEKVKLPVMKQSLKVLLKQFGRVLDVTASANVRMRGQAFVTLKDKKAAALAVKELPGFPLYGKPIAISFAKSPSDALVKRQAPDSLEEHKKERLRNRVSHGHENPLAGKKAAPVAGAEAAAPAGPDGVAVPAVGAMPSGPKRGAELPDEYLPPNKILFVQDLPADTTKDKLEEMFRPYSNLLEVRTVPSRATIAFVEFADEASSTVAKEALHRTGDLNLRVTFAKQ